MLVRIYLRFDRRICGPFPATFVIIVQPVYCMVVGQLQCLPGRLWNGVELPVLAISTPHLHGMPAALSLVAFSASLELTDSISFTLDSATDLFRTCRGCRVSAIRMISGNFEPQETSCSCIRLSACTPSCTVP